MIDIFQLPFMAQALVGCLLLVSILSYFGIHVVLRRIVFVDLALAQVSSVGVAVAILLDKNVTWFALLFTLIGAAIFSIQIKERRIPQEAAIGIVYAVASAVAILLISRTPHGEADVLKILFGNILATTQTQLCEMAAIFVLVGIFHFLFRQRFFAIAVDHERVNPHLKNLPLWDLLFYLSLGLVIAFAIRNAGVLLVFSFLIAPGIFAVGLGSLKLSVLYLLALAFGVVTSLTGLYLSYAFDLPTGATIITACGVLLVGTGIGKVLLRNRKARE